MGSHAGAWRRKFEDPEFALASQMLSFFEGWSEFQPLEVVEAQLRAEIGT